MAKDDLQRDAVKYIRDRAKAAYVKDSKCFICESQYNLDFHHFHSLAFLWNKWIKKNKVVINNVDDINEYREVFISEHMQELYNDTITLCHEHHIKLHSIYGKAPKGSAAKQARWCQKQREKHGLV